MSHTSQSIWMNAKHSENWNPTCGEGSRLAKDDHPFGKGVQTHCNSSTPTSLLIRMRHHLIMPPTVSYSDLILANIAGLSKHIHLISHIKICKSYLTMKSSTHILVNWYEWLFKANYNILKWVSLWFCLKNVRVNWP